MIYSKLFKTQAEAIGYMAKTPFLGGIDSVPDKLLSIPESAGESVEIVAGEDGFIKYKENKNSTIKYSADGFTYGGIIIPAWGGTMWERTPENDTVVGGTNYYAYLSGNTTYYLSVDCTPGETYENIYFYSINGGGVVPCTTITCRALPLGYAGTIKINQGYFNEETITVIDEDSSFTLPRASEYDCDIEGVHYYCYSLSSQGAPEGYCLGVTEIFEDNQEHEQETYSVYMGSAGSPSTNTVKYGHYDPSYSGPLQQTLSLISGENNEVEYEGSCVNVYALGNVYLTAIEIPESVTTIGGYAFLNCTSLTSITCLGTTAPSIAEDSFNGIANDGTLTYPSGSDYSEWLTALEDYNWTGNPV